MVGEYIAGLVLKEEPIVWYGDKIYMIKHTGHKAFADKCPVCDDTKRIKIKGFEFQCPMCQTHTNTDANRLILFRYKIFEIIVNQITIQGPEEKAAYNRYHNSEMHRGDHPSITSVRGFTKKGNAYDSIKVFDIPTYRGYYDPDDTYIKKVIEDQSAHEDIAHFAWFNEKDAQRALDLQTEHDKELLRKFNEFHGTNHEYPFE